MAARKAKKLSKQQLADVEYEARRFARRRIFASVFVLAIVGVIAWQADRWLDVHVKKVQIEGELSASERGAVMNTIASAIESSGAAGLHSLSLDEVQTAVSSLSWADRVSARRRWPDTLVIRLMRHSVVARWGGGGFVASNGRVITPAGADPERANVLPLLNCRETGSARAMEVFNVLNQTLSAQGLKLVELNESELGEWTAGVAADFAQDMTYVTLGRDDLAPRLQRFLTVRTHLLQAPDAAGDNSASVGDGDGDGKGDGAKLVASVDARYHNGVAVRWVQEDLR